MQGRHFCFYQGGKISTDCLGGGAKYEKNKMCAKTKNVISNSGGANYAPPQMMPLSPN